MSDLASIEPERVAVAIKEPRWEKQALTVARYIPGLREVSYSNTFRKAVHGSIWTLIGYGSTQIARTVTTVLLARMLLGPKEFGLVALVNVFISGLEMLSDLGIGMDVVRHPRGDEKDFINTAFLIQAGRGLLLWIVATALAYPFALLYKRPEVISLALVAAISIGLRGMSSGSVWSMTRHVQFKKLTFLTVSGEASGLLAAVTWAIVSPTAWALVVGKVVSTLVYVVGTHLVAEHRISSRWDSQAAKDIFAFGSGIFISTSLYFLAGEGERLVVGKFVNLVEMGCFVLALTICTAATAGLRQVISQVSFPLLTQSVREDRVKAIRNFRSVRFLLLAASGLLAIVFIAGGPLIVATLLGPRYMMTGWILQLLGFRCALELFMSLTSVMLFTVGSSKYHAAGSTAKLIFLGVGLSIAFSRFGFHEAVWILALSPLATYGALLFGFSRYFKTALRTELLSFAILMAIAALTVGILPLI